MFRYIRNFILCIKYPFLKNRNVWTDKNSGYGSTILDWFPKGWRKAFALKMCKDLKKALKKEHSLKDFRINDIKEKYGTLRFYTNFTSDSINKVIRRYELLSMCYCINCGKPVRYVTDGWVNFICEDCMKQKNTIKTHDEYKVTVKDIPMCFTYKDGEVYECSDYSVNFFKLWDLKLSDYIKHIKEELENKEITEKEFNLLIEWAEIINNDISYIHLLSFDDIQLYY